MKISWTKAFMASALTVLFSISTAFAASPSVVSAKPFFTTTNIYVQGTYTNYVDENGTEWYPLICNNSFYIPAREAGMWLGKTVSWNQATHGVALAGNLDKKISYTQSTTANTEMMQKKTGVSAQLRPDITITVDGVQKSLSNALNQKLYPLLYQGKCYIPLRNVSEWAGYDIKSTKLQGNQFVFLRTKLTEAQITDIKEYIITVREKAEKMESDGTSLRSATSLTGFSEQLGALQKLHDEIKGVEIPSAPLLVTYQNRLPEELENIQTRIDTLQNTITANKSLSDCKAEIGVSAEGVSNFLTLQGSDVITQLKQLDIALNQTGGASW